MEKISDKNLICIILTVLLALLTIGSAFHAGNQILGLETIVIWAILYSIQPLATALDKKADCPSLHVDWKPILFRTIENKYLFISFCLALLISMVFDDTLNYTDRFFKDEPVLDFIVVFAVLLTSFFIGYIVSYYFLKTRIEKLKKHGEHLIVEIQNIKFLHKKCYVIAFAINPTNGEKIRLISCANAKTKQEIPKQTSVYFDKKDSTNYYFDVNFKGIRT